jgi:hypothetical protein
MPDLPTLTVTDAQAARLLTVFGSAQAYRDWLKATIIHEMALRENAGKTDLPS